MSRTEIAATAPQNMGAKHSTFMIDAEPVLQHSWRKVQGEGQAEAVLDAVKAL